MAVAKILRLFRSWKFVGPSSLMMTKLRLLLMKYMSAGTAAISQGPTQLPVLVSARTRGTNHHPSIHAQLQNRKGDAG